MRYLWLLFCVSAFGQQQNFSQVPDCSLGFCAGNGVPTFSCVAGQKFARVDTPGTNYTCTGFPPHWQVDASSGVSLSIIGTSGGATLSGGVLNIPQYQGALTITTSGSSGAAVLSGNTLNIPQYGAGITLTTTGTSGAATLNSGVLNIPQYSGGGSGIGSIAWTLPSILTASPPTISASGTQTFSLAPQAANVVFAGPASGSAAVPTFRALVANDTPLMAPINNAVFTGTTTLAADPTTSLGAATKQYVDNSVSGGISGLTAGFLPEASSSSALTNGPIDDGITTAGHVTVSEPLDVNDGTSVGGGLNSTEGTAITAASGKDTFYADSTAHRWIINNNNTGPRYVQGVAAAGSPGDCWGVASDGYNSIDIPCGGSGGNTFSSIVLSGATSGQVTLQAQSVAGTPVIQMPTVSGQMALTTAEVITFSATPTFTPGDSMSRMTLTGNVTSFTLGAAASGTPHVLCFQQGSGPYTVAGPANVHGLQSIGTTNAKWNCQNFMYDAGDAIWLATGQMVTNQ